MADDSTIWKKPVTLDWLESFSNDSMVSHIGITFTEIGPDFLVATMPVDDRTRQPIGLLHGGASVALAETIASTAAYCSVGEDFFTVGIEINANHVRKVESGVVTGTSRPVHLGSTTQVWETHIKDETGRLVCISRMTLSVLRHRSL
jgi:1,4-dihydroxy-2-naphthoyl-CoA hydrolase